MARLVLPLVMKLCQQRSAGMDMPNAAPRPAVKKIARIGKSSRTKQYRQNQVVGQRMRQQRQQLIREVPVDWFEVKGTDASDAVNCKLVDVQLKSAIVKDRNCWPSIDMFEAFVGAVTRQGSVAYHKCALGTMVIVL